MIQTDITSGHPAQTLNEKLYADAFDLRPTCKTSGSSNSLESLLDGFAILGYEPVAARPVSALKKLIAFAEASGCPLQAGQDKGQCRPAQGR